MPRNILIRDEVFDPRLVSIEDPRIDKNKLPEGTSSLFVSKSLNLQELGRLLREERVREETTGVPMIPRNYNNISAEEVEDLNQYHGQIDEKTGEPVKPVFEQVYGGKAGAQLADTMVSQGSQKEKEFALGFLAKSYSRMSTGGKNLNFEKSLRLNNLGQIADALREGRRRSGE